MAKKTKKSVVKKTSTKRATTKSKVKTKAVKPTSIKAGPKTAKSSSSSIVEYKILTEDTVRGLEDQVNAFIKKGWSPIGGVILQAESIFSQTMVRHEG